LKKNKLYDFLQKNSVDMKKRDMVLYLNAIKMELKEMIDKLEQYFE